MGYGSKSIADWQDEVYAQAKKNGFHDGELCVWKEDGTLNLPSVALKLALIHAETSEALEEVRKDSKRVDMYWVTNTVPVLRHKDLAELSQQQLQALGDELGVEPTPFEVGRALENRKPEGALTELADVVIRAMDLCQALGLDLERAIRTKHYYNLSRPFRHGKKA